MNKLALAFLFVCATAFATNDTLNVRLEESAYVAKCDGDGCWGTPRSVPEPSTLYLLAVAGGVVWLLKRNKK